MLEAMWRERSIANVAYPAKMLVVDIATGISEEGLNSRWMGKNAQIDLIDVGGVPPTMYCLLYQYTSQLTF